MQKYREAQRTSEWLLISCRMVAVMIFLNWWKRLNIALAVRDQPEAIYGEARSWYVYRPNMCNLDPSEPRILNRIINERRPR